MPGLSARSLLQREVKQAHCTSGTHGTKAPCSFEQHSSFLSKTAKRAKRGHLASAWHSLVVRKQPPVWEMAFHTSPLKLQLGATRNGWAQECIEIAGKSLTLSSNVGTSTSLMVPQLGHCSQWYLATYINKRLWSMEKSDNSQGSNHICSLSAECPNHFRLQKGSHLKRNGKITLSQAIVWSRVRLSPGGLTATDGVSTLTVRILCKKYGRTTMDGFLKLKWQWQQCFWIYSACTSHASEVSLPNRLNLSLHHLWNRTDLR